MRRALGLLKRLGELAQDVDGGEEAVGVEALDDAYHIVHCFTGDVAAREVPHDGFGNGRKEVGDDAIKEAHTPG
jgi:hypothetical protein